MRTDMRHLMWIFVIAIQYGVLHATTDCADPPSSIAPKDCCNFPRLLKQNVLDLCKNSRSKGNQCFYECVYTNTEMCQHEKCVYSKSEDYVDWVWPEAHDFKDAYKRAYKDCLEDVAEKMANNETQDKKGCDPKPELIELCVENKMISLCPDKYFESTKPACTQARDYFQNCVHDV